MLEQAERVSTWAKIVRTAISIMESHATQHGTYDETIRDVVDMAVEELLCAFEALPVPEGSHGIE